jgi:hypothetical protein
MVYDATVLLATFERQTHPCTSQILKFVGRVAFSRWIERALAVVSVAPTCCKHAGTSEIGRSTNLGIYEGRHAVRNRPHAGHAVPNHPARPTSPWHLTPEWPPRDS